MSASSSPRSPLLSQRISRLQSPPIAPLAAPAYRHDPLRTRRVLLGVECFERHMTSEGHQLQQGIAQAGYEIWGPNFDNHERDVRRIIAETNPGVVIMQDKREWDAENSACLDRSAHFINSESLAGDDSIFRLTICKDAHNSPEYHCEASREIGCHAWIVYYHPDIVCHLAPWIRREHVVRTWHSVDPDEFPPFASRVDRKRCLLSGAISSLYPLRTRLIRAASLVGAEILPHPGYYARGTTTPRYLETLNSYRVSICTSSIFAYSLRKIIESTAAGCVVITDLPTDEVLPEIDENLIRINPNSTLEFIRNTIRLAVRRYDDDRQRHFAERAKAFYDWRRRGVVLSAAIESLRSSYVSHQV